MPNERSFEKQRGRHLRPDRRSGPVRRALLLVALSLGLGAAHADEPAPAKRQPTPAEEARKAADEARRAADEAREAMRPLQSPIGCSATPTPGSALALPAVALLLLRRRRETGQ